MQLPTSTSTSSIHLQLMATTKPSSSSSSAAATARRLYLSLYNWVSFLGWAQVLCFGTSALLGTGHHAVYAAVQRPLLLAQTAALMEILHSLTGLVTSTVSATIPQIYGRMFVTWGVLWSFPEMRSHLLVTSLILSWSITEVIRYPFYGMKETFGFAPSWLLWLRYNTFVILYPTGFLSEVGLIYAALPYMKASERYCIRMPNKLNFSFNYYYYWSALNLPLYIHGFPKLYRYMLARRNKVLFKAKTA